MSYCRKHRHMATPDAMSGRCQECELTALRERVEKAERERDEAIRKLGIAIGYREGHPDMCCGKCSDLLAEAREDIKALATLCVESDWDVEVLSGDYTPDVYAAHKRIRDRKLLEVSDGE